MSNHNQYEQRLIIENGNDAEIPLLEEYNKTENLSNRKRHRLIGVALGLVAALFYSVGPILMKYLIDYGTFTTQFWRSLVMLSIATPSLLFRYFQRAQSEESVNIFEPIYFLKSRKACIVFILVISRGICSFLVRVFEFVALEYIPVGDATVVTRMSVVFVALLGACLFKEKLGALSFLAGILMIAGIVIVTKPPFLTGKETIDVNTLIGIGVAFISMVSYSVEIILLRWLKTVDQFLLTFFVNAVAFGASALAVLSQHHLQVPDSLLDWGLMIGLGSFGIVAQFTITVALKYEEAGIISFINTTQILFVFIWQIILLNDIPDFLSAIGSSIIFLSILLMLWSKRSAV